MQVGTRHLCQRRELNQWLPVLPQHLPSLVPYIRGDCFSLYAFKSKQQIPWLFFFFLARLVPEACDKGFWGRLPGCVHSSLMAGSCPALGVRQAPESRRCPGICTGAGKAEVPRGPFRRKQQFLPLGTFRQRQELSRGSGIRAG